MRIVIEESLFLNIFVSAFILKSTGYIFKVRPKFWLLASVIGSTVSLILPICHLSKWAHFLVLILLSLAILTCVFEIKPIKNFVYIGLTFYGMTMLFGGACYAAAQSFGQLPLFVVAIICSVTYILARLVIWHNGRVKAIRNFVYDVEIDANGQHLCTQGYLDSGNMLYDPVCKAPIVLIDYDLFNKIYSDISLVSVLCKNVNLSKIDEGHYIKINSLSSGASILVFRAGRLKLKNENGEKDFENVRLGLSLSGFEKSLGRPMLLHSEFAC